MNTNKNVQYKPYFGDSPKVAEVKQVIQLAASAQCAVLLLGESGTGKGRVARWIHENSSRRESAFVDVSCPGLKGGLLKSELFGHVRGSFTGAICDRSGLIEEADGGTLFLDEIGDMDIDVQCQLLKAIEEKRFRRVGESTERSSDFRLICATNRDLYEAIDRGTFREDLFFRINTLAVDLPALRSRKDDIAGLTNHMLEEMDYDKFPVSKDIIKVLKQYKWRGNIRELRNTLERALILAQGQALTLKHFADIVAIVNAYNALGENGHTEVAEPRKAVWNMDTLEEAHIRRALMHFRGDKMKTSTELGISLSCLYRKLGKMGLQRRNKDMEFVEKC